MRTRHVFDHVFRVDQLFKFCRELRVNLQELMPVEVRVFVRMLKIRRDDIEFCFTIRFLEVFPPLPTHAPGSELRSIFVPKFPPQLLKAAF